MAAAPPAKKARLGVQPEDLRIGTVVVYHGTKRGVVIEAFAALNQFWLRDEQTGEKVRKADGSMANFSADSLKFPPKGAQAEVRLTLIGNEAHMATILRSFGAPDTNVRKDVQMFLALPCELLACGPLCGPYKRDNVASCDEATCSILQGAAADDAIPEGIWKLAKSIRPDQTDSISLRPFGLKEVLEELGSDVTKMTDYYCLTVVSLPPSEADIKAADPQDREDMQDVQCHIDLNDSARGPILVEDEGSFEKSVQRVGRQTVGIELPLKLLDEQAQLRLRKKLGVENLPVHYKMTSISKGFVVVIPNELVTVLGNDKIIRLEGAKALQAQEREQKAKVLAAPGKRQLRTAKTGDDSALPEGWERCISKSSGKPYYFHAKSQTSTYDIPLPPGWTKEVSNSSGKVYYFHAKSQESSWYRPLE